MLNQLAPQGNYLLVLHNRLPRFGYRLSQTLDLLPPSGNYLPRPCSGLRARNNGLVRMYDYLSRALYWWFPGLQKTFWSHALALVKPGHESGDAS